MSVTHGTFTETTIRSAAVLTAVFVDSIAAQCSLRNQVIFQFDFSLGSLTRGEILIQASNDNINWRDQPLVNIGSATTASNITTAPLDSLVLSLTADKSVYYPLPITFNFVRIRARGVGTAAGSSLACSVITGIS